MWSTSLIVKSHLETFFDPRRHRHALPRRRTLERLAKLGIDEKYIPAILTRQRDASALSLHHVQG
jgi:hypothetical protein